MLRDLLADPQTSGGLLLAVPEAHADALLRRLKDVLPCAAVVGEAVERQATAIIVE